MRNFCKLLAIGALFTTSPAIAATMGIPPSGANLPAVSDAAVFGANTTNIRNNGMSAMCLDCHTQAPYGDGNAATHFVSAADASTHSGGGGINAAGAKVFRDNSAFFKLDSWGATGPGNADVYSKYGNFANNTSVAAGNGSNPSVAVQAAGNAYDDEELICESCHNVVANANGGNNLYWRPQTWTDIEEADLCIGCHGFMYTTNAENANNVPANNNYADTRNNHPYTGGARRDNNENHFAYDTSLVPPANAGFAQNHHVMTGDVIDAARAAQGLLWTDNLIIAYSRAAFVNNAHPGSTYPAESAGWTVPVPSNASWMTCTNCHMPGHGGDTSEGASILRGAGLGGSATYSWQRNWDAGREYKKFQDLQFCGQCHNF